MRNRSKGLENEKLSGPAVQKKEILFFAGLLTSWLLVLYFFVQHTPNRSIYPQPDRPTILSHLGIKKISPSALKNLMRSDEDSPANTEEFTGEDRAQAEYVMEQMKSEFSRRRESFFKLVTAEPGPPVVAPETLVLETPVIPGSVEDNDEQDDVLTDQDPAETPASEMAPSGEGETSFRKS